MAGTIKTYGEVAAELGVRYEVISTLVEAHGLTPKRVPHSGAGKGLDPDDIRVIRKALNLKRGQKLNRPAWA